MNTRSRTENPEMEESNFKVRQMQGQNPLNKFPGHQLICLQATIVAVRISHDPSSASSYNQSSPNKAEAGRWEGDTGEQDADTTLLRLLHAGTQ